MSFKQREAAPKKAKTAAAPKKAAPVGLAAARISKAAASAAAPKHTGPAMNGIKKPVLKRLAYAAGIGRIGTRTYAIKRREIDTATKNIVRDAQLYMAHGRRRTLDVPDVMRAFDRQGHRLYGFGGA
jgi:histone H3/H4